MNNREIKVWLLSFTCSPYRERDPDCHSSAARKLHIKQATWQRRCSGF